MRGQRGVKAVGSLYCGKELFLVRNGVQGGGTRAEKAIFKIPFELLILLFCLIPCKSCFLVNLCVPPI